MTNRPQRTVSARTHARANQLTLAIVDPSSALRAGLPLLLPGVAVTGSHATVESLLTGRTAADVVLMDIAPDGGAEPTAVRLLIRAGYLVCLYTFEDRAAVLARYIAAGVRGIVSKSDPVVSLVGALARIAGGGTAISNGYAHVGAMPPELTLRQAQILAGRARGETFHSIARRLDISERTAQDHWSAIARRFENFLRTHSPADLERSLGLDNGVAQLEYDEIR